jgi:hypothetical protein
MNDGRNQRIIRKLLGFMYKVIVVTPLHVPRHGQPPTRPHLLPPPVAHKFMKGQSEISTQRSRSNRTANCKMLTFVSIVLFTQHIIKIILFLVINHFALCCVSFGLSRTAKLVKGSSLRAKSLPKVLIVANVLCI